MTGVQTCALPICIQKALTIVNQVLDWAVADQLISQNPVARANQLQKGPLVRGRQIKKQKAAIDTALQDSEKQLSNLEGTLIDSKEKDLVGQVRERQAKFFASVAKFLKVQTDGSPDEARESLITDVRPAPAMDSGPCRKPSGARCVAHRRSARLAWCVALVTLKLRLRNKKGATLSISMCTSCCTVFCIIL